MSELEQAILILMDHGGFTATLEFCEEMFRLSGEDFWDKVEDEVCERRAERQAMQECGFMDL